MGQLEDRLNQLSSEGGSITMDELSELVLKDKQEKLQQDASNKSYEVEDIEGYEGYTNDKVHQKYDQSLLYPNSDLNRYFPDSKSFVENDKQTVGRKRFYYNTDYVIGSCWCCGNNHSEDREFRMSTSHSKSEPWRASNPTTITTIRRTVNVPLCNSCYAKVLFVEVASWLLLLLIYSIEILLVIMFWRGIDKLGPDSIFNSSNGFLRLLFLFLGMWIIGMMAIIPYFLFVEKFHDWLFALFHPKRRFMDHPAIEGLKSNGYRF